MKFELRFVIEAESEAVAQEILNAMYAEVDDEIYVSECRRIEEHGDD